MNRRMFCFLFVLGPSLLCFAFAGDGKWLSRVPQRERVLVNPYADDSDASMAGEKLFAQHCAECHGRDGGGLHGHPAVVSARVRHASDGELHWLLRNGSLRNGMPSWSSLPEQQRWQIITYLRNLQERNAAAQP